MRQNDTATDFHEICEISYCLYNNLSIWECTFFPFLNNKKKGEKIKQSHIVKINKLNLTREKMIKKAHFVSAMQVKLVYISANSTYKILSVSHKLL